MNECLTTPQHEKQIGYCMSGYLMRQDNTIYTFSIKLSFSSIGQDKWKLQKQISKILSKLQWQLDRNVCC